MTMMDSRSTTVVWRGFAWRSGTLPVLSKLESLRHAQIAMLRHYNPNEKKLRGLDNIDRAAAVDNGPFFWGAFTLSGDWR